MFDALLSAISPTVTDIVSALVLVAALIYSGVVVVVGVLKVLSFIQTHDDAPKIGMQYEEWIDGRPVYRTWTKKDDFYYRKKRDSR